eukprot:4486195-Pleurochrysis_carterae.AAC.1
MSERSAALKSAKSATRCRERNAMCEKMLAKKASAAASFWKSSSTRFTASTSCSRAAASPPLGSRRHAKMQQKCTSSKKKLPSAAFREGYTWRKKSVKHETVSGRIEAAQENSRCRGYTCCTSSSKCFCMLHA